MAQRTFHEDLSRRGEGRPSSDRSFGLVFAAVFAIVGLLPALMGGSARRWALATAAVLLVTALGAPIALRALNRAWLRFGAVLHRTSSFLIMGIMFFLVITPVAMFMRLIGRDVMKRKFDPTRRTYWVLRSSTGTEPAGMRQQF